MIRRSRAARLVTPALLILGLLAPGEALAADVSSGAAVIFGGGATLRLTSAPVTVSGEIVERFHGDAATGCGRRGTCGYAGTVNWRPSRTAALLVNGVIQKGRQTATATLAFGSGSGQPALTAARVHSAGGGPACVDGAPSDGFDLPVAGGTVTLDMLRSGVLETGCAGPLGADVAGALPTPRIRVADLVRRTTALDLSGTRSFAAGGYAGTITSTLRLLVDQADASNLTPSGSRGSGQRERLVAVTYRGRLTGAVPVAIGGVVDPIACSLLSSCGASGSLDLRLGLNVEITEEAYARASRPRRDLLAALGLSRSGNPRGVSVFGGGGWHAAGTLTAALRTAAGLCTDTTAGPSGSIALSTSPTRARVEITSGDLSSSNLRTRCPGPGLVTEPIASGSSSLRYPLAKRLAFRLTQGASSQDDGWTMRTRPRLSLSLTRTSVRTTLFRIPTGV